jgi:hypothetical protein
MSELALDDVDRHSFAGELDGMRVAQLIGREPPPDAGVDGERAQFGSSGGRGPAAAAGGSVDDAEQRSGRQQHAVCQPGGELFEPELVHSGLAALVTFAVADQERPAPLVDVGLVKRQRLRDPQPATPQHSDQRPERASRRLRRLSLVCACCSDGEERVAGCCRASGNPEPALGPCPLERRPLRWELQIGPADTDGVTRLAASWRGWWRRGRRVGEIRQAVGTHASREVDQGDLLAFGRRSASWWSTFDA